MVLLVISCHEIKCNRMSGEEESGEREEEECKEEGGGGWGGGWRGGWGGGWGGGGEEMESTTITATFIHLWVATKIHEPSPYLLTRSLKYTNLPPSYLPQYCKPCLLQPPNQLLK